MKRLFLLSIVTLLTVSVTPPLRRGGNENAKALDKIEVHTKLKPYFIRLVCIVEENDLNVNWDKIRAVDMVPLLYGVQGYWAETSRTVIISHYFSTPPYQDLTEQELDDLILMCLAHEVGHSQGLEHTAEDRINLMSPDGRFALTVIRGSLGVEQYIINCFKKELK